MCLSSPCLNNAICEQPAANFWRCVCPAGFTGLRCDQIINYCSSNPCSPNGVCIPAINSYSCSCNTGFGGVNCQTRLNYCIPNPCVNGNCTQLVGGYSCVCPPGFAGLRCETYLSQCTTNPCLNNGLCQDNGLGGYNCKHLDLKSQLLKLITHLLKKKVYVQLDTLVLDVKLCLTLVYLHHVLMELLVNHWLILAITVFAQLVFQAKLVI